MREEFGVVEFGFDVAEWTIDYAASAVTDSVGALRISVTAKAIFGGEYCAVGEIIGVARPVPIDERAVVAAFLPKSGLIDVEKVAMPREEWGAVVSVVSDMTMYIRPVVVTGSIWAED